MISPNIEAHLQFRFYMKLSVGVHVSFHVFSFVEWAENLWVVNPKLYIPATARTSVDWKLEASNFSYPNMKAQYA